ncbi:MAG: PhoH family protein [Candidatus Omnitrophica bacterium]|nr:PhoH family protein [Candidatus Omnitrophota bacterium]MCM8801698.1 PhoH family protein [Candidatus Omnitrophota bacterium]
MIVKKQIEISNEEAQFLYGIRDENLEFIENLFGIEIFARGNLLTFKGENEKVEKALKLLNQILKNRGKKRSITKNDILITINEKEIKEKEETEKEQIKKENLIWINSKKDFVIPKTPTQRKYVEAIRKYDLVIGIGPAGTGKTYLAVACGIEAIKKGYFQRIVLTRPALEAGERLGFLPGDLEEKIKPYLQPIYDAIFDLMKYEELRRWQERKIIEIIPLAYMRGRTLSNAFIILDEAQNTSFAQMKMFLTRLGIDSKIVITGDITQIDHPLSSTTSGLVEVQKILSNIRGIKFIYFTNRDVVRHKLVKKIINAYEKYYKLRDGNRNHTESEENKNK